MQKQRYANKQNSVYSFALLLFCKLQYNMFCLTGTIQISGMIRKNVSE